MPMPFTKSGLWIPEEYSKSSKVADRPHWISVVMTVATIALAIISTIIARNSSVAAKDSMYIAQESLRISRTTQIASQRAYPAVEGLTISRTKDKIHIAFDIVNYGNTPAYEMSTRAVFKRYRMINVGEGPVMYSGIIQPKQHKPVAFNLDALQFESADYHFAIATNYIDVFDEHNVNIECPDIKDINIHQYAPHVFADYSRELLNSQTISFDQEFTEKMNKLKLSQQDFESPSGRLENYIHN
jgi:hypothetical protein